MATYTMYLKDVHYITRGKIGLDRYPIFSEAYREGLNQKILDRYYNREIGMETIDLFQLAVHRLMNEQMPLYNQLYVSAQLKFDPLSTVNLKTMTVSAQASKTESEAETDTTNSGTSANTNSGDSEGTHTANSGNQATNTARGRSVTSETPQSMLADDGDYATGAADSNSENTSVGSANETGKNTSKDTGKSNTTQTGKSAGTQKGQSDSTGTQEGESTTTGYQGLTSDMILRYRETFMNIDLAIINMLGECFMNPWDNGDRYNARDTLKFFTNLY